MQARKMKGLLRDADRLEEIDEEGGVAELSDEALENVNVDGLLSDLAQPGAAGGEVAEGDKIDAGLLKSMLGKEDGESERWGGFWSEARAMVAGSGRESWREVKGLLARPVEMAMDGSE